MCCGSCYQTQLGDTDRVRKREKQREIEIRKGGKPRDKRHRDKYRCHLSCRNRLETLRIERQAESFDRVLPMALMCRLN